MDAQAIIFVLGMHRSGTSVLTRALPVFGVDIGEHHLGRFDNPRGFFEDPSFVRINEALLASLHTTWDALNTLSIPSLMQLVETELGRAGESYLMSLQGSPLVGRKDPRATLLFPFWAALARKLGLSVQHAS